jgi:hypothetical protein
LIDVKAHYRFELAITPNNLYISLWRESIPS